jgi:hypothetical protein
MRRIPVRRSWAAAVLGVAVLVVAGAVVGFSRSGAPSPGTTTATRGAASAGSPVADMAVPGVAGGESFATKGQSAPAVPPDGGPSPVVPGAPRVVKTADLRVKVAKGGFSSAFDRVAGVAAANGGFVSGSSTASADDVRSGDLTVRVPSDRFDAVRSALAGLGKVEGQSIRGEDVSGQLVDYDARLRSLQAQEDALRTLVGQAKAVGDVLSVQSSLFSVRQQIEQLKAQKANLEQATSLATIQVSLFEPGAASVVRPVDDRSLGHSLSRAVDGMVAVVGGMILVVGWLSPLAVVGLLVWGGSRVLRRRQPAAGIPAA